MICKTNKDFVEFDKFLALLDIRCKRTDFSPIRGNLAFMKKDEDIILHVKVGKCAYHIEKNVIRVVANKSTLIAELENGEFRISAFGEGEVAKIARDIFCKEELADVWKIMILHGDRVFSMEPREFNLYKSGWLVSDEEDACLGYLANDDVVELLDNAEKKIYRENTILVGTESADILDDMKEVN